VLAALDAQVRIVSATGERTTSVHDLMIGVKRTSLQPGELIVEITLPIRRGWQGYTKVGVRNAMVIAVASACLAVDADNESVAIALGSVGPTIIRCTDAEAQLAAAVDWATSSVPATALEEFARAVSATSRPITDHRSTADYRRHAVGILGKRLARRAFTTDGARA
jgi:CO/xanthine dehydrogenase FAD-binding subunit